MRKFDSRVERYRVRDGQLASDPATDGRNGCFVFSVGKVKVQCIVSDGSDWAASNLPGQPWEHVSVSIAMPDGSNIMPTWSVMCFVKDKFWKPDEAVIQFHPREQDYVNFHRACLHLWRPVSGEFPCPPHQAVGPKL